MKKLLAVLTLLIPFSSIGALINADWLNAGDNRAVLDTTTGLEWLDMKATNSYSYNEVIERLDSTFLGWRLATEFEVNQLMNINIPESIGLSGWDQFPDTPEMYNFRTVFGKYQGYSLMRYVPENWDPASDRVFAAGVRAETGSVYLDYDSGGADSQTPRIGTFLVRGQGQVSVSEPSGLFLFSAFIFAALAVGRKTRLINRK